MKRMFTYIISKIPVSVFLDLLYWKISTVHNLRESGINSCDICNYYFNLKYRLEENNEF